MIVVGFLIRRQNNTLLAITVLTVTSMSEKNRLNFKELQDIDNLRETASKSLAKITDDRNFLTDVLECIDPYYDRVKGKDVVAKVNLYKGFLENDAVETLWQMLTLEFEAIQQTEKRVVVLEKEIAEYKSKCAQIAALVSRQCDSLDTLRDVIHTSLDTAETAKKRDDELLFTISDMKKTIVELESKLKQCNENLNDTSVKLVGSHREKETLKVELEKKTNLSTELDRKSKELAEQMKILQNKYEGVHHEIVQLDTDLRSNEEKIKKLNAEHERKLKEVRLQTQKEVEDQWTRKLLEINENNHQSIMKQRQAKDSLEKELFEAREEVHRKQERIDKMMHENQSLKDADKRRVAKLTRNILASIHNTHDSETSLTREPINHHPGGKFQYPFARITPPPRSRSLPRSQETQTKTSTQTQRSADPVNKARPTNLRSARK